MHLAGLKVGTSCCDSLNVQPMVDARPSQQAQLSAYLRYEVAAPGACSLLAIYLPTLAAACALCLSAPAGTLEDRIST